MKCACYNNIIHREIPKTNFFIRTMYIGYIFLWAVFEIFNLHINDNIKYFPLIVSILLFIPLLIINNKIEKNPYIIGCLVLILSSLFYFICNGQYKFALLECLKYIIPLSFYLIVNSYEKMNVDFYFKVLFWVAIFVFFVQFKDEFTLDNIFSIDFIDSYSPFENNYADIWLFMFVYFLFKKQSFYSVVSFCISFMSFKRVHVIFLILYIILFIISSYNKRFKATINGNSKMVLNGLFLFICILLPIFIDFLYSSEFEQWFSSAFNLSFLDFSKGRSNLYSTTIKSFNISYGLGTIQNTILDGMNLHCDIMTLSLELGLIPYIIYIYTFYLFFSKNKFGLVLFMFYLFNMIFSHIIDNTMGMFFAFCLVGFFNAKYDNKENLGVNL